MAYKYKESDLVDEVVNRMAGFTPPPQKIKFAFPVDTAYDVIDDALAYFLKSLKDRKLREVSRSAYVTDTVFIHIETIPGVEFDISGLEGYVVKE